MFQQASYIELLLRTDTTRERCVGKRKTRDARDASKKYKNDEVSRAYAMAERCFLI
jgi:hypothetical protein